MFWVAFNFLRTSWVGKALAIVMAVLAARAYWKHQGGAEQKVYMDKKSNARAEARRENRNEIDRAVTEPGAADRLRSKWSRD